MIDIIIQNLLVIATIYCMWTCAWFERIEIEFKILYKMAVAKFEQ